MTLQEAAGKVQVEGAQCRFLNINWKNLANTEELHSTIPLHPIGL